LLLPVLVQHLLFHKCLDVLEETIDYKFNERLLLQVDMTVSYASLLFCFTAVVYSLTLCMCYCRCCSSI